MSKLFSICKIYSNYLLTVRKHNRSKVLIFCQKKVDIKGIYEELRQEFSVGYIHGDVSQYERQKTLTDFKRNIKRVLLSSDLARRGLDIPDLELVI